ncbi:MAG: hypothetical protein OXF56_23465 [Rhodobacteraceae bacterium]|nr:hypothetical protein [Paracoccaceae bacterium]
MKMTILEGQWSFGSHEIPTGRTDAIAGIAGGTLAAAGFYVPAIPLTVALVGIIWLAMLRNRRRRFTMAFGWHFAAAAGPLAGLWNTGASEWLWAAVILYLLIVATAFARWNAGVVVAASMMNPWHIGSVPLAAGELWPGTGLAGLILLVVALTIMDGGTSGVRSLCAALTVGSAAWAWSQYSPAPAAGMTSVPLSPPAAITRMGQDQRILASLEGSAATAIVTGENIIDRRDPTAMQRWCDHAARTGITVFAGVLEKDLRSTVHLFSPTNCRVQPVYERLFGLPGIEGGWGIGRGVLETVNLDHRPIHWLICFETFSPLAWLLASPKPGSAVVIIANDYWIHPVPVDTLRTKVAGAMARLLGVTAVTAESRSSRVEFQTSKARQ